MPALWSYWKDKENASQTAIPKQYKGAVILSTKAFIGLPFQADVSAPFKPGKFQKVHFFTPSSIFIVPISNKRHQSD